MREPEVEPETQSVEITEVKSQLVSLVHDVAQKQSRFLVEEAGTPVAALVSLADYRQLTRLDAQIAEQLRLLEEIREAFSDVSPEERERETAKAVAEVRAEMRAEREATRRS
ncbi:MAG: type II toxin-antitoxin system Phd/YefM family antitoxin [Chloroflexota bacterium]|nr:type II toxin-antitoxin system Phd/YefM family antitoxin [Chloroflexota bacterium]